MRTLAISHERDAGPGVFADAIETAGHRLDVWHVAEDPEPPADPLGYEAVMTFGGSMHPDHEDRHPWLAPEKRLLRELLDAGMPLLGVCLGAQLLAEAGGGSTVAASEPEIGWFAVEVGEVAAEDPLLGPLAPSFEAFQWHSYQCLLPPEATVLASSPVCAQAFRLGDSAWGIQFHAEVAAADARAWIDNYEADPDAVALGVDPATMWPETSRRAPQWNELGRALCRRFLAAAETYSPVSGVR